MPRKLLLRRQICHGFVLLFGALLVGCSAKYPAGPSPTATLAGVRIHYPNPHAWVNPGNSVSLSLYAIDTQGVYQLITPGAASWSSSNSSIATVTNGTVRGLVGGDVDIVATYQGYTSTARVVILDPAVRYPWLDIRTLSTVETGGTTRGSAVVFDSASSSRTVTDQATWSSSDTRVFTVQSGQVTAVGPGTAYITATYNGLTATVYASVPPIRKLP